MWNCLGRKNHEASQRSRKQLITKKELMNNHELSKLHNA